MEPIVSIPIRDFNRFPGRIANQLLPLVEFQSLLGILINFRVTPVEAGWEGNLFQSLLGILIDFRENNPILYLHFLVSIPIRDFN